MDNLYLLQAVRYSTLDCRIISDISQLGHSCSSKARSSNAGLMKTTGPHEDTDHFLVSYFVLFCCYVVKFIPVFMTKFTANFDFGTFLGKATPTTLALRILKFYNIWPWGSITPHRKEEKST